MSKRVAVLLVRNFSEALRERRIQAADSEPYWLTPEQYAERDGGVQLFPLRGNNLMDYARKNSLRLLGIIILAENGDYSDFMNDEGIALQDQDFARKLFE